MQAPRALRFEVVEGGNSCCRECSGVRHARTLRPVDSPPSRTTTIRRTATLAAALFLTALALGCSNNPDQGLITAARSTASRSDRVFTERERLGNPLVSEVMIRKARHHDHNTGMPSTDVAEFTGDLTGFVTASQGAIRVTPTRSRECCCLICSSPTRGVTTPIRQLRCSG